MRSLSLLTQKFSQRVKCCHGVTDTHTFTKLQTDQKLDVQAVISFHGHKMHIFIKIYHNKIVPAV